MNRLLPMIKEYGFKVVPTFAMINNVWCKRHDIASVRFKGHHIMTIPVKMLGWPNERYTTLEGNEQPMFFDREHKLRNWNLIIKNTPHIQKLDEQKKLTEELAHKLKQYV